MAKKPNIVLICNDDHAQWALGCYGNREIRTPTVDFLAETGVVMENAFTPIPVCSPARACLLTGRLPSQHGVHDYIDTSPECHGRDWLRDETTLAMLLSREGYETALCGKWHLGNDEIPQPGYDFWYSLSGDYPIPPSGEYRYSNNGKIERHSGFKTQLLTDKALEFLAARDDSRPFFLHIGYVATHHPWSGHPERLVSQYRSCKFDDVSRDCAYPFGVQSLESTFDTRNDPREALAQYAAAVSEIDEATGRIIDSIGAAGIAEDTLVIFTSDHGLCCGQHGIWGKGNGTLPLNMVEEAIRVPLILWQPGRLFGRQRRRELVDHLDLFQTIVEHAGIELPTDRATGYPGESFLHLIDNSRPPREWRTVQFGEYGNLRMIRTESFKMVVRYPNGPCELFDLRVDPREERSLYADPAYQTEVASLTAQLDKHFEKYSDSEKSGLRVQRLPRHNSTEAWRSAVGTP